VLMRKIGIAASLMAVFLGRSAVCADQWPQRAVRVVVPFAAGSGPDFAARLFAERLGDRWRQPVVIENRPGADGLIGTAAFLNLQDDHVLMFSAAAPLSVLPVLQERLPYDPARDVAPIAGAADTFGVLAVAASVNVGTVSDLVAYARWRPGQLNYHALAGAFPILFTGFKKSVGVDMGFVGYRETSAAVLDLSEGRIQLLLGTLPPLIPQINAGKVRPIAVTNKGRAPLLPHVPTVTEAGFPVLTFESIAGFFGPQTMPSDRRDQISADVREVAAHSAIRERLASVGQVARSSSASEFAAAIDQQRAQITTLARQIAVPPNN
jgi:tripartite-type tricarboxylate transporter receptor subunit TctC